jgi:hypothetical protein
MRCKLLACSMSHAWYLGYVVLGILDCFLCNILLFSKMKTCFYCRTLVLRIFLNLCMLLGTIDVTKFSLSSRVSISENVWFALVLCMTQMVPSVVWVSHLGQDSL